jgi:hypothetical protein
VSPSEHLLRDGRYREDAPLLVEYDDALFDHGHRPYRGIMGLLLFRPGKRRLELARGIFGGVLRALDVEVVKPRRLQRAESYGTQIALASAQNQRQSMTRRAPIVQRFEIGPRDQLLEIRGAGSSDSDHRDCPLIRIGGIGYAAPELTREVRKIDEAPRWKCAEPCAAAKVAPWFG